MKTWFACLLVVALGCSEELGTPATDDPAPVDGGSRRDGGPSGDDGGTEPMDGGTPEPDDLGAPEPEPEPCRTRITYGSAWIHSPDRTTDYDVTDGRVTWDGSCQRDGSGNSFATLSNGWQPYFEGVGSCVIALDVSGACEDPPPDRCTTRIGYGSSWLRAPGHPNDFDDANGVVTWDGTCGGSGSSRPAPLSNGWVPHFDGPCDMAFRYEQCGGLFANPVVPTDCPDPGVTRAGDQYVMACTSGGFVMRTSPDLVHWSTAGRVFPSGNPGNPTWATRDFWAPEIHQVGDHWVVYYSARHSDGHLSVGAARADDVLGPYTDIGHPLVYDPNPGVIDAHFFEAPDGRRFLTWKVDGNAVGRRTPIYIQPLADDGLSLTGSRTQILTNDRSWEGALVEGQWMIHEGDYYYLFYSANGYATARYAAGVARATSPTGPFTKLGDPILTSNHAFGGPGHGSVVRGPSGEWVHVYHSWLAGSVGGSPGRVALVDRLAWRDGWPRMDASPNPRSQPMP